MRKLLIVIVLFLVVGCTVVRMDVKDIDNIVNVVLSKDNNLYNRVGKGYKYYIPRGVTYIDTFDLNEKLYSQGYNYFIYIDAVAYYHQTDFTYEENPEAYYSRAIDINGKKGYLEINEINGLYFIEYLYNYAKIEVMIHEENINSSVLNISYILSTVKFNNNVIRLLLEDDYFATIEETYDVFAPKGESGNFLKVEYE